jgi:hypothetical protein
MFCHCAGRLLLERTCGKLSYKLLYFRSRVTCITFVSVSVRGKCFVHNLSKGYACKVNSFLYGTLGLEVVFLAFQGYGALSLEGVALGHAHGSVCRGCTKPADRSRLLSHTSCARLVLISGMLDCYFYGFFPPVQSNQYQDSLRATELSCLFEENKSRPNGLSRALRRLTYIPEEAHLLRGSAEAPVILKK